MRSVLQLDIETCNIMQTYVIASGFGPKFFAPLVLTILSMAGGPIESGTRVYYFAVRVNWDKLMAIDQQNESFKAQIFVEATLVPPQQVRQGDEEDVKEFFSRATVENSLEKPDDDKLPKQQNWRFVWLIHGEFGEELELRNFPFDTQDLSVMLRFGWSL